MGRASKRKEDKRSLSPTARKVWKQMRKESKSEMFVVEYGGKTKVIAFNPMKRLLKDEPYVGDEGKEATKDMIKKYEKYYKTRLAIERNAKKSKIDPDGVITD